MNRTRLLFKQSWHLAKKLQYKLSYANYSHSPDIHYDTLRNGMVIAYEQRNDVPSVCFGFFVDAGSRYENLLDNGSAHLFEHILLSGSRGYTDSQIAQTFNERGMLCKCSTTRDMGSYCIQCLGSDFTVALPMLYDCVFRNKLNQKHIDIQKEIIYNEMLEHEKNTSKVLFDLLHATAFQGTPMEYTVMGLSTNLKTMTTGTMQSHLNKFFLPSRTVLAGVGCLDYETFRLTAIRNITDQMTDKCVDYDVYRFTGSEVRYRNDDLPMVNVAIAVEGPCLCEGGQLVMEVASHAIGSWDRSQPGGILPANELARNASEDHTCDGFRTFNMCYKDSGLWGTHFISSSLTADNMCTFIQEQWKHICCFITDTELDRAKMFLKTRMLSEFMILEKECYDLGRWTLYNGSYPTIEERLHAVDKVRAADLHDVCSEFIYNKCPAVAAIGTTEGLFEYNRIRGNMYWLRI